MTKSLARYIEKVVATYLENPQTQKTVHVPNVPKDFEKFNTMIGLPVSPDKKKTIKLLPFQIDIDAAINKKRRVIINKSRKIGVTETVLRSIAMNCFFRYAGYDIMIVAGNRMLQAEATLDRFSRLFENGFTDLDGVHFSYSDLIKKSTKSSMKLFNGTTIRVFPADAEAVRGPDHVICVFLDEAAFIRKKDDAAVYGALRPNIANTDGDLIIVSTPNGKRGIFYDLWNEGQMHKMELPYTLAVGKILSEEFILEEKKKPKIFFEQEYECKFTTSKIR